MWRLDIPALDKAAWHEIGEFEDSDDAVELAQELFGSDEYGRIQVITPSDDIFIVDIPDWRNPEGPWLHVRTFETFGDAQLFVKDEFLGDSEGLVSLVTSPDADPEPLRGPREWSPRRKKRKPKKA